MRNGLLTRDAAGDPQVIEQITREMQSLANNTKEANERVQREWAEMQKTLTTAAGNVDALTEEKINRLSTAITERITQSEAQFKTAEQRLVTLETASQRSFQSRTEAPTLELRENVAAYNRIRAAYTPGLQVSLHAEDVTAEELAAFAKHRKATEQWLRRGGDDPRATYNPELVRELSVAIDPEGGYFVRPEISARISARVFDQNPMREIGSIETITTDALEILTDPDEADAGWAGEKQARTETGTPEVGKIRIPVHELTASPYATQKFLEDAGINPEDWLARKLGDKFARTEGAAMFTGDGVNKPSGFLNTALYPAVTGTPSWAAHQIEDVKSGSATGITWPGICNIMASLQEVYHRNAIWVMKRASIATVMTVQDPGSHYIFAPMILDSGKLMMTLNGYPIRFADAMPTVSSGVYGYAFGDFREGYVVVDRLGMSILRDPYSHKPYVEFYTRRRVGGAIRNFDAVKRVTCAS